MNSNLGKEKFFVVYQITNLINNKIYIGIHTTYNINDKYMGSSKYLKKDIKELERINFKKEILHVFDNKEDMLKMEAKLVNKEFCHRIDTYNRMIGGINDYFTTDMISVKDKDGNNMKVYNDDLRWLSGELVGVTVGKVNVRNEEGNIFQIDINDKRYLNGELVFLAKNKIVVKDKDGNIFQIDNNNPRYLSGELVSYRKGLPQHPNFSQLGKKHRQETKDKIGKINSIHQKGEKNSQFGTCWITNNNENKKIKREELNDYLVKGWIKGRK